MALISELLTKITADNSQFNKVIDQTTNKAQSFSSKATAGFSKIGGALTAIGGLGIGAVLTQSFKNVDKLAASASKLNIAISSFQFLEYAAKRADVPIGTLENGLQKLRLSIGRAAAGNKTLQEAFKSLGTSADELSKMDLADAYVKISEGTRALGDDTKQTTELTKIFGKSAQEQLNALRSDLSGTKQDFDSLGITISEADVASFSKADKAIDDLTSKISGGLQQAIVALAPTIELLAVGFNAIVTVATTIQNVIMGIINSLASGISNVVSLAQDAVEKLTGSGYDPNATIEPGLKSVYRAQDFKNNKMVSDASNNGSAKGKIDINVSADKGLKVEIAESPEVQKVIDKLLLRRTAQGAQQSGF